MHSVENKVNSATVVIHISGAWNIEQDGGRVKGNGKEDFSKEVIQPNLLIMLS